MQGFDQKEMGLQLGARATGNVQEAGKVLVSASAETLCDVGHHRDRSPAQLVTQGKVTLDEWLIGQVMDFDGDLAGYAPSLNIAKMTESCHNGRLPDFRTSGLPDFYSGR